MKPWCISVWDGAQALGLMRRELAGANGVVYINPKQEDAHFDGSDNDLKDRHVFYTDTEGDAINYAKRILEYQPTAKVCVSKVSHVFQRALGPIQTSKFTDKGLLPA